MTTKNTKENGARIATDSFGKKWAILPWAKVTRHVDDGGPDYWARSMTDDALAQATLSECPYARTKNILDLVPWASKLSMVRDYIMGGH